MPTLKVYPNPFAAFDKNGVPCGVCPRDPEADAGGPGHYVGARVDRKNTKVLQDFVAQHSQRYGAALGAKVAANEIRSPMQATFFEYMGVSALDPDLAKLLAAKDPIEIPVTKFYKDRLREGSLLPADLATAQAARLPRYQPAAEVLAHLAPKPVELPEVPGFVGLPQSPDAEGNLLEAPALPEGAPLPVATEAVADGTPTTLEASADAESSPKIRKPKNEASK